MAEAQATEVVEEYLETIYRLQSREGVGAKTSELTRSLKVVPGTVTNTIEKLEREGYVEHKPYRGVKLTEKGQGIALQVIRRHRLSERLLTDILRVDPSKAHEVACKIEHDIADEEIIEKIEEALGNPKTCPHGNPIPPRMGGSKENEIAEGLMRLGDLEGSAAGIVVRFEEDNPVVFQIISSLGIKLGAEVELIEKESTDGAVAMRVDSGAVHRVSREVASSIIVMRRKQARKEDKKDHAAAAALSALSDSFGEYER